tara:strand:+ start:238 stop:528 length:291 start_codon:yes stop_codon:yes gene_type:complete
VNKRFIKEDISKYINKKIGLSTLVSKKITNDIIEIFSEHLISNHLLIKNFGSFYIKEKNQRLGRNPKTLEKFTISKRKVIVFKASKKFIKNLNKLN